MEEKKPSFFELALAVNPTDIDHLGHVNNVVYLRWVQDVAAAHWKVLASAVQQNDLAWVVVKHEINYHRPAYLEDQVIARTWVGETAAFRSTRHVEIYNAKNVLLVSATTIWCLIDPETSKPKKITEDIRNILLPGAGK